MKTIQKVKSKVMQKKKKKKKEGGIWRMVLPKHLIRNKSCVDYLSVKN